VLAANRSFYETFGVDPADAGMSVSITRASSALRVPQAA
jgi:hypothetical protein